MAVLCKDYNDIFKGLENDKEITEDDLKRLLDQVQKATDENMSVLRRRCGQREEVLDVDDGVCATTRCHHHGWQRSLGHGRGVPRGQGHGGRGERPCGRASAGSVASRP